MNSGGSNKGGSNRGDSAAARAIIENTVRRMVSEHKGKTVYRDPVFGYADAEDPAWVELRDWRVPGHLLPSDVLPEARSVACFFLPFARDVVMANARATICADEWALAYVETNSLLASTCAAIQAELERAGMRAAWQQPTHNYDPCLLRSTWSHKSAAVIAGMGTIGLHQMLITERGCAGRVSSIVIDVDLCGAKGDEPPDAGSVAKDSGMAARARYCGFLAEKRCTVCMQRCPVSAISENGVDKVACQRRLREVAAHFARKGSIPGKADVCGKCATGPCAAGPCALAPVLKATAPS